MKTSLLSWSMVLVATALVACGDDSNTTSGSGGAGGGDATTATSSSGTPTTTTSGTPTSTSSTPTSTGSSSDGGGGGGTGGNGEGAGNCTAITLDDIENNSQQGVGFLIGTPNPNVGGDLADLGQVEVYDDGGENFDGAEPGEYDLSEGAEANYASCSRCVRVLEDIDEEEGGFARQYFQASGTWELAEEGNFITNGRGTLTLTDVVLTEVTIDPDTFESTPVADGACLYIASLEYDDPLVIPDDWECDPTYFDAGDGCDCECGAYDPDCDDPGQGVFGCDDSAPFCDATGVCADVPAWWSCDDGDFGDGATCNCECGGPDPDCDGINPVDGCDDGQTCGGAGVCLDPEDICDDLTDNDEDRFIDCDDATACTATATCTPGATAIGLGCDEPSDCTGNTGAPICLTDDIGFTGGQCGEWCDLDDDGCPDGTACTDFGVSRGVCVPTCDTTDDCANPEAECSDGLCIAGAPPPPPVEWVCQPEYFADGFCDCGCGAVDFDCPSADPDVCEFCELPSCANDGSDFDCDLDLLVSDDNSQCL